MNRTISILALLAALGFSARTSAQTPHAGVDCWMPKAEAGSKESRLAPTRRALLEVERAIKANHAFVAEVPEPVRMEIFTTVGEGPTRLEATAYARQSGPGSHWTASGCDIVRLTGRSYQQSLGRIDVVFNQIWPASHFSQSQMKPVRTVAGFPMFEFRHSAIAIVSRLIVITKDGHLPIVPFTLADRLDREAQFLAKRLDEVARLLDDKTQASVATTHRQTQAELRRQVEALRTYRAGFSADQLRAAWVEADVHGPEARQFDARIKAVEALPPSEQAQVSDLGAQARQLQRQAMTRGTPPEEAARLRNDANGLLNQARAIQMAHSQRVAAEVMALRNDFRLQRQRPGDASQASEYKDDPNFWDRSDPNRVQLITVAFNAGIGPQASVEQTKAWMDKVEASLDYAALKALIR